ncbi:MAG TPA: oxygen-independent coproporphyrinogen III oxidase [Bdellovibrionales bacterium]|nr:oxygen-independent coproporphyrinogen III oxidase [Bdellovibrionales bacterium]
MNRHELAKKYDVPVPRYTSYPTVPYWSDSPTTEEWVASLQRAFAAPDMTWALYLHIPFCETLCTFCGCNTMIGRSHDHEAPYVQKVLKEFDIYRQKVPGLERKPLRQLHIGGGTPTFLSAGNLTALVGAIMKSLVIDAEFEGSLEVDPRRTTPEQLRALYDLGFRRVSMGVQDFDPEVQRLVNRIQPYEVTANLTKAARDMGYTSVNFDLIYGLPKQMLASFTRSIERTVQLRPDRIALYSFALVPWIKPQQRLFKDSDLPSGEEKRALYEMSYEKLIAAGYVEIGMDHFALPDDPLAVALKEGRLHRNFMGYADRRTDVLLGLGVSSISETPDCFHQNEKVLPVFERQLGEGKIPTHRGHKLTPEDQAHREQILEFMTKGEVKLKDPAQVADIKEFLADMIQDGLVTLQEGVLKVTEEGRLFQRNACVALDQRLRRQKPTTKVFSQAL